MIKALNSLRLSIENIFEKLGDLAQFSFKYWRYAFAPPLEWKELLHQAYQIGYRSLFLVSVTGFIIGMVMALQMRPTMQTFGAEAWLPAMVSISIIREIGPVLTALICAGKVASGIGAELGSMKVTEQVDAMAVSGTNPFKYLVVTRVTACMLMVPILVIYADAISLIGSFAGVNMDGEVTWTLFFQQSLEVIEFSDFLPAFFKSFLFGFAIGIVGCYRGLHSAKGTSGVGRAATSAVVIASMLIFIFDLLAVQITQMIT